MSEILQAILAGIFAGILIAVLIGPVFFALIQTTLKQGLSHGIAFSGGIVTSDSLYFLLALIGISSLNDNPSVRFWLSIGGGAFLAIYGFILIFKHVEVGLTKKEEINVNISNHYFKNYMKGFLFNSLNPSVIPLWGGVIIKMQNNISPSWSTGWAFFAGVMATIFGTDCLKAVLALRLKSVITDKFIYWMNKIIGIFLVVAGGNMIFHGLDKNVQVKILHCINFFASIQL
jgi:threonine/homoserine/homoserine lactone efflux protein